MTRPAAPLEKAVAQGRAAMARWDKPEPVPVLRHSDAVDCVLALRALLAALDADKRLEEAEAALREIKTERTRAGTTECRWCGAYIRRDPPWEHVEACPVAIASRYFARREGEKGKVPE